MWKRKILINVVAAVMISGAIAFPAYIMQSDNGVNITSPVEGKIVSGIVDIIGTTKVIDFAYSELAFSNAVGPVETWFPISESTNSVVSDFLFAWDTNSITNGEYRLRLRVFSNDNSINEYVIPLITIRNYTLTMAPSPSPTFIFIEPTNIGLDATETPAFKPTELPTNPLALTTRDLAINMSYGILTILGLIGISRIYSHLRRK